MITRKKSLHRLFLTSALYSRDLDVKRCKFFSLAKWAVSEGLLRSVAFLADLRHVLVITTRRLAASAASALPPASWHCLLPLAGPGGMGVPQFRMKK
jgi:hypothetical protein